MISCKMEWKRLIQRTGRKAQDQKRRRGGIWRQAAASSGAGAQQREQSKTRRASINPHCDPSLTRPVMQVNLQHDTRCTQCMVCCLVIFTPLRGRRANTHAATGNERCAFFKGGRGVTVRGLPTQPSRFKHSCSTTTGCCLLLCMGKLTSPVCCTAIVTAVCNRSALLVWGCMRQARRQGPRCVRSALRCCCCCCCCCCC
jgi:hypothetical protein